jgi:alkylhydroperoxidase/carboxymuconolactone decarboxylase family protein YurZ
MVTLDDVKAEALICLGAVEQGDGLDPQTAALIGLAVHACAATLDNEGSELFAARALDAGANGAQIHEVLLLISGLGVHTLIEGSLCVARLLRARGDADMTAPLDDQRARLWEKYVGDAPYWNEMEKQAPGFLDALLRLCPEGFEAFFNYCAVPWKTGALRALTKELVSIAVDAMPAHRYLPGLRLHLANAVQLGAGRAAILQTLDIAASAPPHRGVR